MVQSSCINRIHWRCWVCKRLTPEPVWRWDNYPLCGGCESKQTQTKRGGESNAKQP